MVNLNDLNDMQKSAAQAIEGPVLILAGAGSGKTRTISYRIAHMVKNLDISPQNILGISFTNKAATELKERVLSLIGKSSAAPHLSTFHSLGIKILKKQIHHLGYENNFTIFDSSDQISLVRSILKNFHDEKKFDAKVILSKIGLCKNKGISEDAFPESELMDFENPYDLATEHVYKVYQNRLHFYNAIDFDDILFLTVKLFETNPDIQKLYSEHFKYIMVDEYQDTNSLQFRLLKALTSCHDNLCVVGDDDQSIYAFRGADVSNILNFNKQFPNAMVIKLEQNYRSTTPILNLANNVIQENKVRSPKKLWTSNIGSELPYLWAMGENDHEAQVIVEDIENFKKAGGQLNDVAILYRSNTQAPIFEEELNLAGIQYKILGGQKFYEKKEIKDILAYLVLIQNPHNEIALRRVINTPHRGVGITTLKKYLNASKEMKKSLFKTMKENPEVVPNRSDKINEFISIISKYQAQKYTTPLNDLISSLIEEIDYSNYMVKNYSDNPKQLEIRKNDINYFIQSAARTAQNNEPKNALPVFLERMALEDNQEQKEETQEKQNVTMMTLHSSKGLEFNRVYLVGVEEEMLPHKRTISEGEDISEERRLFYVGVTRARQKLIMSYCKERTLYGRKVPRQISRFLLGPQKMGLFQEQDRTTFGHMSEEEVSQYKKSFFHGLINSLD